ncbi:MAG TPA: glycosyltransferase family 39 protein [Candidatus Acidoferrum sp.]|nr:glycosyltransferase family 39 protein [Candidatus Acidoferrum sp.]
MIWIFHWPLSIESEGVYYARIAENLLAGRGYVGAREAGKQLLYPPLYPWLVAGATAIVGNSELAGRIVSAVCGSLWVIPLMFIARSAFGGAAGLIAGIIAVVGPPLIAISGTVQSEPAYLVFQAAGVYFALQIWPSLPKRACYLGGVCFGIAYLARPEASIYIALTTLFIFLTGRTVLQLKSAARLILAFVLTILPYVVWLSIQTGSPRLEAKSVTNYVEATGWAAHLPPGKIFFAVDDQLNDVGLSNQSDLAMIQKTKLSTAKVFWLAMHGASTNVMRLLSTIMESRLFGGSLFLLLLGLGFVAPAPDANSLARRGFLFAAAVASIVPLFSLHAFHDRFVFPFLTLLLPFAAGGVVFLYRSLSSTLASGARLPALLSTSLAGSIAALVLIGYLATQAHTMKHLETDARLPEQDITVQRGDVFVKNLGQTIRSYGVKNALVMDGTPAIGYYAGAADWPLPYCDSETAIRYIEKKAPDFVVLQSSKEDVFPYLKEWIEKGIPDPRMELVYRATAPNGEVAQVYRRR